ncbi:MAG: iron hydrogenase small subunit [Syntrophomonadaceae bacterium]|nr:iron hydrogenase small subunit [Syntrophomonadaceae bacterium]MDD3889981.1 iron hydrogenase small subunit [Syntrophomonadaceae bacterium]MDD4550326.1 iron hydrogenase small subunit [Syntrophomonadaceae bacterium]
MSIFTEKDGITRRQFFKGAGMLAFTAVVAGVFAKVGVDVFAASDDYIQKRAEGLYTLDEQMAIRKSHENPEILQIYKDFLSPGEIKPVSEKAHHLLHTRYGKDIPGLIEELATHHDAA